MKRTEPKSDRVVSIALSVLVHGAIVGALLWGWWQYRTPRSAPDTLAIQATLTNTPQQVRAPQPRKPSVPASQAATPLPPAPPPPDDQARLQQQAQQRAAAQQAAQKAAAQQQAATQAAQQAAQLAAQQQADAEKVAAEHAAAVKAAAVQAQAEHEAAAKAAAARAVREQAARAARQQAQREAKLAAERKAREQAELKAKQDAAREAQVLAQQLKAEQAEQQRAADLQRQMQAEEHLDALESSPEKAEYLSLIQARISRAWVRPASAQPGVKCTVHLTQIPGGEITHVAVEGCNGDEAVRQSVQTAAYRASPLPAPPDPALFDPNITVTFAPGQ